MQNCRTSYCKSFLYMHRISYHMHCHALEACRLYRPPNNLYTGDMFDVHCTERYIHVQYRHATAHACLLSVLELSSRNALNFTITSECILGIQEL